MKKLLSLLLIAPSVAFADRLGSLKSSADVLLTTQAVSASGFIQNTSILQSGATFYVSSGTVNGLLTSSTMTVTGQLNVGGPIVGTGAYLSRVPIMDPNNLPPFPGTTVGSIEITKSFNSGPYPEGFKNNGVLSLTRNGNTLLVGQSNAASAVSSICVGDSSCNNLGSSAIRTTAVGNASLSADVSGEENACFGFDSCQNITGNRNALFGAFAGATGTTAAENTGMGWDVLPSISTGTDNSCFGKNACDLLTYGSENSVMGNTAGADIKSGNRNVCLGGGTGSVQSCSGIVSGSSNTAVGNGSLGNISYLGTEFANTTIGYQSSVGIGVNKSVCIGYQCIVNSSFTAIIGNIGTSDALLVQMSTMTVSSGSITTFNLPALASQSCLGTDSTGKVGAGTCSGGSGSGIVSPGTFTWTNTGFGVAVSTLVAGNSTSTSYGNNSYVTINSSGTSQNLTLNINGQPSGGVQNKVGGLTINALGPGGPPIDMLVLYSSYTSAQGGSAMLSLWQDNPLRNDPMIWLHRVNSDSSPEMRWDGPSPNMEMVMNSGLNNSIGEGKWEPFAIAAASRHMQCGSNRANDNGTFENLCELYPLYSATEMPGVYYHAQSLADDSGLLASSDTASANFFSLNAHTVGLTGPQNPSASYVFGLPDTVGAAGQIWYNSGNRGGNFNVRQLKQSTDMLYSATTGLTVSTITVTSSATFSNITINGTCTGSGCGTGSSGGSSALQVTSSGVQITSPTASMNFDSTVFNLAAVGSTSTITMNSSSVTLQGNNLSSTYLTNSSATATYLNTNNAFTQTLADARYGQLTAQNAWTNAQPSTYTALSATGFTATDSTSTNFTASKYIFPSQGNTRVLFMNGSQLATTSVFTWNGSTLSATNVTGSTITASNNLIATGAAGATIAYGLTASSITASSVTVAGQMTAGTYQGASLAACGDGSHALSWSAGSFGCQAISAGTGDMVLASTQTSTGAKTFLSADNSGVGTVIVTSTGTSNAVKITANGVYGTSNATSGGLLLDCTGGGQASGMCSQIYSNAGAQTALDALQYIRANNTAWNEPLLYLSNATSSPQSTIRIDSGWPTISLIDTSIVSGNSGRKFQESAHLGVLRLAEGRNTLDNAFDSAILVSSMSSYGDVAIGQGYNSATDTQLQIISSTNNVNTLSLSTSAVGGFKIAFSTNAAITGIQSITWPDGTVQVSSPSSTGGSGGSGSIPNGTTNYFLAYNSSFTVIGNPDLQESVGGGGVSITSATISSMTATTLLRVPQNGQTGSTKGMLSYDATNNAFDAYGGANAGWGTIPRVISIQSPANDIIFSTVATINTEAAFSTTYTFPANFWTAGKSVEIAISNQIKATATVPTWRNFIRLSSNAGANIVYVSSPTAASTPGATANASSGSIGILTCISAGASGSFVYAPESITATVGSPGSNSIVQPITIDTTVDQILQETQQFGSSSNNNTDKILLMKVTEIN